MISGQWSLPVCNMNRTPLDLDCQTVNCINDNGTEDEHGAKDDADDDDVCKVCLLSCFQQSINCQRQRHLGFLDDVLENANKHANEMRS